MNIANSNNKKTCPNCLAANGISADFCSECGYPIGDFVNIDPLGQIQSQGHLFRKAADKPRSLIIVLGLWTYFGTTAIGIAVIIFFSNEEFPFLANAFFIGTGLLSCAILYKATKNYLFRR